MEGGFSVFVEYFRSIFHEEIALFLTLSLFLVLLGAIAISFTVYFAFLRVATLLGYDIWRLGSTEDLHHLEEAQATRQLKTLSKLPCSQTCYCRCLGQIHPELAKKGHSPVTQPSEKHRDSTFEVMFTIISSSSSSSFGSGKSDSLDNSITLDDSPAPSYRSKLFSPPGLSPYWTRSWDSSDTSSSSVPPSPVPSYRSRLEVVNTPPAAHVHRDARRDSLNHHQPVSHVRTGNTGILQHPPSYF